MAAEGLLEGGVDLFILETHFDLLAVKAVGHRRPPGHGQDRPPGARSSARSPWSSPAACSLGTEIGAALAAIDPLKVDIIGLNCATGPTEMSEHLRHL